MGGPLCSAGRKFNPDRDSNLGDNIHLNASRYGHPRRHSNTPPLLPWNFLATAQSELTAMVGSQPQEQSLNSNSPSRSLH